MTDIHVKNTAKRRVARLSAACLFCLLLLLTGFVGCAAQTGQQVEPAAEGKQAQGSYTLVGIGPGEADLLTARAVQAIQRADLVFCNPKTAQQLSVCVDLKGKTVMDGYGVLFRYYGRPCPASASEPASQTPDGKGIDCEQYHRKQQEFVDLVRQAVVAGRHVVMLSSGDPTIYGPDLWSVKALKDLQPKVVPGLSSLNAANAALQAGLGEVIITAAFQQGDRTDTIQGLAGHNKATMVIFMPRDMKALLAQLGAAYPAGTPAAVVSNAGSPGQQQVILGTVGDLGSRLGEGDRDHRRSLVYVGEALSKATFKPARDSADRTPPKGKFYLVGMGPGDADLATLRAAKVIEKADLVFASEKLQQRYRQLLAGKQVLDGYGRLFPFYGKSCADVTPAEKASERDSCEEYHRKQAQFEAMVRQAVADGKTVAMLDSGDPLIYGPCSWSLTALRDLETEVVPGLSCFNAANAALQAGVTEGGSTHSVLLASGWSVEEMAVHKSTMVLFTMRTDFKKFIDSLSRHYPPDTPVGIVMSAGYAEREAVLHGTLGGILNQVGKEKLPFEYLLYVGDFLADGGKVAN